MTKLTIEHLSCYLPYGLKVKYNSDILNMGLIADHDTVTIYNVSLGNYKPILRPLSDLNTSNHLVELAKIDGYYTGQEDYRTFRYGIEIDERYKIIYNLDGFHVSINNQPARVNNQIELFGYLYKQKFDIHGLIEKTLAISIHDVEGEVY